MNRNALLLFVFLVLVPLRPLHGQDSFRTESGTTYDLTDPQGIPLTAVGAFFVTFSFHSPIRDAGTGRYSEPSYEAAYSLRLKKVLASEYQQEEFKWVFGGDTTTIHPDILSFDPVTGNGTAQVVLPYGAFTRSDSWGQAWVGENELIVYWGMPSQMLFSSLFPPAAPDGSKTIDFTAYAPEISLLFPENRAMVRGQPSTMFIMAKEPWNTDRVFSLSPSAQRILDLPATIVLPAGQYAADVTVTPVEVGTVTILATSDSYPDQSFVSQEAHVHRQTIATSAAQTRQGDTVIPAEHGHTGINRICVPPEATTPADDPGGGGTQQDFMGPCRLDPQPSDCWLNGPGGKQVFVDPAYCKWTWNIFSACQFAAGHTVNVQPEKWKLMKREREECGSVSVSTGAEVLLGGFGFFLSVTQERSLYRYVCTFKKLPGDGPYITAETCGG